MGRLGDGEVGRKRIFIVPCSLFPVPCSLFLIPNHQTQSDYCTMSNDYVTRKLIFEDGTG
ncbi:MAG TPA: hypothetical protein VK203_13945 [Nostocaceae cyanobacterium]|nr:hypothetical protein [Nostocaceae cyanobacterium]